MPRRYRSVAVPSWMWFFIALPLGIIFAFLWQRRQGKFPIIRQIAPLRRLRYVEPDSIPIDTRPSYDMAEMEEAFNTDHAFAISQLALEDSMERRKQGAINYTSAPIVDDLQVIEGIGPKIAQLLKKNAITNFQELADTPVDRLESILASANMGRLANPGTWPEQARLAADGDWDGLTVLQKSLKGGRRIES